MTKTLTMDKAGRITLPKEVRDSLGASVDSKIRLRELANGKFVLEVGRDPRELRGIIKNRGIHLTIEEIGKIIEEQGNPS